MKLVLKVLKTVLRNQKKLIFKNRLKHLKRKCFSVLRQKQTCSHGVKDDCKNLRFSFNVLVLSSWNHFVFHLNKALWQKISVHIVPYRIMKRREKLYVIIWTWPKFSENWPLNFGLQNMTYKAVYLAGHVLLILNLTLGSYKTNFDITYIACSKF